MDLVCTFFAITFHPAPYPSEEGAIVLLAEGAWIDAASPIVADISQIVEEANYARGSAPDFFPRGNRAMSLQWEEVVRFASPAAALATSLERQESMPRQTGWALLEIPSLDRSWAIRPVAFRSHRTTYGLPKKSVRYGWELASGDIAEIVTMLYEDGEAMLYEDGDEMLYEF